MKNTLDEWIALHEQEFIQDITALVEIPSVSVKGGSTPCGEECFRALEKMLELGKNYGLETEMIGGRCGRISLGEAEREIGIWNHLDIVPAGEGWTYPPFACQRQGDFLIGRGTQDNKGPAVAVLYALRYLKEQGMPAKVRFSQILGCEEECGMVDAGWYVTQRRAPDWSFVADCGFPVCCGEKGICRIALRSEKIMERIKDISGGTAVNSVPAHAAAVLEHDGELVSIEAEGISGHAAFPEGTENAVKLLAEQLMTYPLGEKEYKMAEFLGKICTDGYGIGLGIACEDSLSGRLTCNCGLIRSREGAVIFQLDIRYPVTFSGAQIIEKVRTAAEEGGFRITETEDDPPFYLEPGLPFIQILMEAYQEETKERKLPYVMGGGTYARRIPHAVAFGPGMSADMRELKLPAGHGGCHSADEAQSIANLQKAIRIYVQVIEKLNLWMTGETNK